ncbi:YfhJ family protein [Paenibacillus endoradicis]|uniref:YfhJ family protein n=1 Tax=Paenibacillus endoradicis TaxID=2972487 RepID=UPI0021596DB6|nr:YfhJ family protein [Paenibacillus endoradicis]MCR8659360.1 YfhJ family protein [Paenibacillus endoradicis]
MLDNIKRLTELLMEKNPELPEEKAMIWVELLWSDYESTSGKAGFIFQGADYTENLVRQLITSYGDKLHLFIAKNSKYANLLSEPTISE